MDAQRPAHLVHGNVVQRKHNQYCLRTALSNESAIEVVDPQPIDLGYERIEYHRMTAADYVSDRLG